MANDKKISEFLSDSTIDDSTEFTFVLNNTNFKTTFADLKTNLGTVGQLSSVGDVAGIPVLNQPSPTTNEIKKIIGAKGIVAGSSPGLGVEIAGLAETVGSGVPVLVSSTSDTFQYRSVLAGGGINVTQSGQNILIETSGEANPSTNILITQESDFPTQDASTISLEAGFSYQISGVVTTAKTFVCDDAVLFSTGATIATKLTYTGSGNMFSITNNRLNIHDITIDSPNGTTFNIVGDGTLNPSQTINAGNVIVSNCVKCIDATDHGSLVFSLVNFQNVTGPVGVKINGGSNLIQSFSRTAILNLVAGAVAFDFNTSASLEIELIECFLTGDSTAIAISGAANSANLLPNQVGSVTGCNFASFTAPLQTVSQDDVRWEFFRNAGVPDSLTDSLVLIDGNATETVIAIAGTGVLMAGTFTDVSSGRFTVTASGGRMTYNGERSERLPIDYTVSVILASGGSKQVSAQIRINGSAVGAHIEGTASGSQAVNLGAIWQHDFQPNDYVELWLGNDTDTVNVIGVSAIGRVN